MYKLLFPILVLLIVSCSQEEDEMPDNRIEITFQRTVGNSFYNNGKETDTITITIDGALAQESNLHDFNYSILDSETKKKTYYYLSVFSDTCYYFSPDTLTYTRRVLKEEKEILGYQCKKATFISDLDTITAYYTGKLSGKFTFRPGLKIDGTILEMTLPDRFGIENHWKAVSIENQSKKEVNYPAAGYYNDEDEEYLKRRSKRWNETLRNVKLLEVGQPAPVFSRRDINGKLIDLENLKGKVVFMNFWSTSCRGCIQEMPELNKVVNHFKDQNVVFISVAPDSKNNTLKFLRKKEFNFMHIANENLLNIKYGVTGRPASIIIDKDGNVAKLLYPGEIWTYEDEKELIEIINGELNK